MSEEIDTSHLTDLFGEQLGVQPRGHDDRVPQNVWLVQQDRSREQRDGRYIDGSYHSQKMVPELCRQMLRHLHAQPGATVLDPFMGSGTTLVEGHEMGLRVVGCELVPTFYEKCILPNLALAKKRRDIGTQHDVRVGDARDLGWLMDESCDFCVTSPPYGDCDPSRDSNDRTIGERAADGEKYAKFVLRTSAFRFDADALRVDGAMGSMKIEEWEVSMARVLCEIRRVLKPGGFALFAVREYWRRKSKFDMVDLPGRLIDIAKGSGMLPYDIIYALDCCIDEMGVLRSRGSLHQNRLSRKLNDGRSCPRGVPAVTRVVVLQRRERKA